MTLSGSTLFTQCKYNDNDGGHQVRYEYMHYFVRLEEGSPPRDYWAAWNAPGFNPSRMLEEWVKQHRKKFVPYE